MYSRPQKLAAELFGTFGVVLISAGAICADQFLRTTNSAGIGPLGIALAYGLAYGVFMTATGHISGGHLNPAVTAGYWVTRRLNTFDMLTYMIAQLAGATGAAYFLRWVVPEETWRAVGLGIPDLASGVNRLPAMLIEGVLTLFLVFVVFATAADRPDAGRATAGMSTGLLIAAGALFGAPFTGAAMNPARVFGPALAARHWSNHGVYWAGPLAGSVVAAAVYDWLFLRNRPH